MRADEVDVFGHEVAVPAELQQISWASDEAVEQVDLDKGLIIEGALVRKDGPVRELRESAKWLGIG